eukprot:jgi/Mesvir1/17878/Mv12954-RA.1
MHSHPYIMEAQVTLDDYVFAKTNTAEHGVASSSIASSSAEFTFAPMEAGEGLTHPVPQLSEAGTQDTDLAHAVDFPQKLYPYDPEAGTQDTDLDHVVDFPQKLYPYDPESGTFDNVPDQKLYPYNQGTHSREFDAVSEASLAFDNPSNFAKPKAALSDGASVDTGLGSYSIEPEPGLGSYRDTIPDASPDGRATESDWDVQESVAREMAKHKLHINTIPQPVSEESEQEAFWAQQKAEKAAARQASAIRNTLARARRRIQDLDPEVLANPGSPSHQDKNWRSDFKRWRLRRKARRRKGMWLWRHDIQSIEGHFGSAVALTFAFLRWVLLLNILLSLLWLCVVIIPFWVNPPRGYSWGMFGDDIGATLVGSGLEETWVLYSGYRSPWNATASGECMDAWDGKRFVDGRKYTPVEEAVDSWYSTDIAYSVTVMITYLVSFVAIMWRIARRISGSGDAALVDNHITYPWSSAVFGSWDFHLTSLQAASNLRRAIRNRLREMLADEEAVEDLSPCDAFILAARRVVGVAILSPALLVGTGALIYYLVEEGDRINDAFGGFDYAQGILLSVVNLVGPIFVYLTMLLETWPADMEERISTAKLYVLRMLNVGTLVYRLFKDDSFDGDHAPPPPPPGSTPSSSSSFGTCEETEAGLVYLRFLVAHFFLGNIAAALYKAICSRFSSLPVPFDIAGTVIDIIHDQALIWLGCIFVPLLPIIGVVANVVTFYVRKLTALKFCSPSERTYSVSRTDNLSGTLVLFTLLLACIPMVQTLLHKGTQCGPIPCDRSMSSVLTAAIDSWPSVFNTAWDWIVNPIVLAGVILLLIVLLVLVKSNNVRYKAMVKRTQAELYRYRGETATKMSYYRRQAQEGSITPGGGSPPPEPLLVSPSKMDQARAITFAHVIERSFSSPMAHNADNNEANAFKERREAAGGRLTFSL